VRSRFDSPADAAFTASRQAEKLPTSCPACQSSSIVTTAKNPDADSYWRCKDCGEVWNASRSEAGRGRSDRWR
jgi:predicted Zn finger-like uncharacterized protein